MSQTVGSQSSHAMRQKIRLSEWVLLSEILRDPRRANAWGSLRRQNWVQCIGVGSHVVCNCLAPSSFQDMDGAQVRGIARSIVLKWLEVAGPVNKRLGRSAINADT